MRLSISAAPLAAALLLAGCSPEETADGNQSQALEGEARTGDVAAPAFPEPEFEQPDAGNSGESDEAPAADETATPIPARFHGEWSADPKSCGQSHETRLRIGPDELRFHESSGAVRAVKVEGDRAIEVTAAYSGEGETWTNRRRLTLSEAGDTLTVTGDGSTLTRSRCP